MSEADRNVIELHGKPAWKNGPTLAEFPRVCDAAQPYWEAFDELSSQREIGMGGVGAIRLEALLAWLNENEVDDPGERSRFRHYVTEMDSEYMKMTADKQKQETDRMKVKG